MAHAQANTYGHTPKVSHDETSVTVELGNFRFVMDAAEAVQLLADLGSALHTMPIVSEPQA